MKKNNTNKINQRKRTRKKPLEKKIAEEIVGSVIPRVENKLLRKRERDPQKWSDWVDDGIEDTFEPWKARSEKALEKALKTELAFAKKGFTPVAKLGGKKDIALKALQPAALTIDEVAIEQTVSQDFLYAFLLPAMTLAYTHGVSSLDDNTSYTYSALNVLVSYFNAIVTNSKPEIEKVPKFIAQYAAAMSQKKIPTKKGKASYRLVLSNGGNTPPNALIYNNYRFFLWVPNTVLVDGYFTQKAPVGGNLVSDWGEWLKFLGDGYNSMKLCSALDLAEHKSFMRDASLFSGVFPQFGTVFPAIGYSVQLFSPSHIRKPLLATVVPYQDGGYTDARMYAGTSCHTGMQMLMNDEDACTSTKITPKFKFLDFCEIFEIYVVWLIALIEAKMRDQNLLIADIQGIALNAQQLAILLRQDIAYALSPMVYGGQELEYEYINNTKLTPMLFGSNAYPQAFGCPFPQVIIENIRALRAQRILLGPSGSQSISYYSPVLCVNTGTPLFPWQQNWVIKDSTGNTTAFFQAPAPTQQISMVDGSYPNGAVNLNSPVNNRYIDILDNYVRGLSQYTYTLGMLDTDDPCLVLHSLKYTRYIGAFKPNTEDTLFYGECDTAKPKRKLSKGEELVPLPKLPEKMVGQGFYDDIGPVVTSSTYKILAAAWTNLASQWWLPVANYLEYPNQALAQSEDVHIFTSVEGVGAVQVPTASLTNMHNDYVSSLIRGPTGADSIMEAAVKEAEKYGRGGFFKTLLGPVAEMIMPGASGLLEMLPM